eukprot:155691-Chlamydomonas_euryale.AAC.1
MGGVKRGARGVWPHEGCGGRRMGGVKEGRTRGVATRGVWRATHGRRAGGAHEGCERGGCTKGSGGTSQTVCLTMGKGMSSVGAVAVHGGGK